MCNKTNSQMRCCRTKIQEFRLRMEGRFLVKQIDCCRNPPEKSGKHSSSSNCIVHIPRLCPQSTRVVSLSNFLETFTPAKCSDRNLNKYNCYSLSMHASPSNSILFSYSITFGYFFFFLEGREEITTINMKSCTTRMIQP